MISQSPSDVILQSQYAYLISASTNTLTQQLTNAFYYLYDIFSNFCVKTLNCATDNQRLMVAVKELKLDNVNEHFDGETLFYRAARLGNLRAMAILITKDADISIKKLDQTNRNSDGSTPLCIATQHRQYEAMKLLLLIERELDWNFDHRYSRTNNDHKGGSPISMAGFDIKALDILMNAQRNERYNFGFPWEYRNTVFAAIEHKPRPLFQVIEIITRSIPNDWFVFTPLAPDSMTFAHYAVRQIENEQDCIAVLEILKKYGADLHCQSNLNQNSITPFTPLQLAEGKIHDDTHGGKIYKARVATYLRSQPTSA